MDNVLKKVKYQSRPFVVNSRLYPSAPTIFTGNHENSINSRVDFTGNHENSINGRVENVRY
jgi:hypothetical protein